MVNYKNEVELGRNRDSSLQWHRIQLSKSGYLNDDAIMRVPVRKKRKRNRLLSIGIFKVRWYIWALECAHIHVGTQPHHWNISG